MARRLLELCQREDLNLSEIAEVIETDAVLAAKVLRMANSPGSGLRDPAKTVRHALALLGVNTVRTLVLSFALASELNKTGDSIRRGVWERSIWSAIAAREIARVIESRLTEEAFLSALLQDVGILALAELEPMVYRRIWGEAQGDHGRLVELEQEAFETDHAEVSDRLVTRFNLPRALVAAVAGSHDQPGQESRGAAELGRMVALSGSLADIWVRDGAAAAIELARQRTLSLLGWGEDRLGPILQAMAAAMTGEIGKLFEAEVGSPADIQAILQDVNEALVMATFRAQQEADRAPPSSGPAPEEKNRLIADGSQVDKLTQLCNREGWDRYLGEQFQLALRKGKPLSVLICDIDDFTRVNDSYGDTIGDRVLVAVAGLLSQKMRGTDRVARYGGEAFAVVLPNTPASGARVVAERLRARIEGAPIDGGADRPIRVTVSIGSATLHAESYALALDLARDADGALVAAKRYGRNRVVDAAELSEAGLVEPSSATV